MELVVLSRLYDRCIIVYNEAGGLVHEQVFQSSEDQASSQNSPVSIHSWSTPLVCVQFFAGCMTVARTFEFFDLTNEKREQLHYHFNGVG